MKMKSLLMNTVIPGLVLLLSTAVTPSEALEVTAASGPARIAGTAAAPVAGGGYVLLWQEEGRDGDGDGIFGRLFDGTGKPAGTTFAVNTETASSQTGPAAAGLPDGGFVVVWTSYYQDGSMGGIYGQRFGSDGAKRGGEFLVNTNIWFNQSKPSVAALPGGGFVVVWQSPDDWTDGIFARVFSADGTPLVDEIQVNTYTAGLNTIFGKSDSQMNARVAAADGGFVVVWESYRELNGNSIDKGISCRRFDADGTPRDTYEFSVNALAPGNQENPAVAPRKDDGFLVVWSSPRQDDGMLDLYGRLFASDGAVIGDEFPVNTFTGDNQMWPALTLLSNGETLVSWYSNGQDGDSGGIYGRKFNGDGTPAGDEFRLNDTTAGRQAEASIVTLAAGTFAAGWATSFNLTGGGATYKAVTKAFLPPGAAPAGPTLDVTSPATESVTIQGAEVVIRGSATGNGVSVAVSLGDLMFEPAITGGSFEQNVTLPGPGTYTIVITARDDSGGEVTVTRTVICEAAEEEGGYHLSLSTSDGGWIELNGSADVSRGMTRVLRLYPEAGFHVGDVTINGRSSGGKTKIVLKKIKEDLDIVATFVLNTYPVRIKTGRGGTVTSEETGPISHGGERTYAVTPQEGYIVSDVVVNGEHLGGVGTFTLSGVKHPQKITAKFAREKHPLTIEQSVGGRISGSADDVIHGGSRTLRIRPDAGYHVAAIVVDGETLPGAATYTFTNVTAAHAFSARFEPNG